MTDFYFPFVDTSSGVRQPTDVPETDTSKDVLTARRAVLQHAADLIDGDRNAQYGDPIDDFRRTGIYWSTHAGGVLRRKLNDIGLTEDEHPFLGLVLLAVDSLFDPHDVAIMMTQLKNSRLAWSPEKYDHWADGAGYYGCGWDCVVKEGLSS